MTARAELVEAMADALYEEARSRGSRRNREFFRYDATAALTALEAKGWAVVPREATDEMLHAGALVEISTDFDEPGRDVGYAAREVWIAMLSAASLKE